MDHCGKFDNRNTETLAEQANTKEEVIDIRFEIASLFVENNPFLGIYLH